LRSVSPETILFLMPPPVHRPWKLWPIFKCPSGHNSFALFFLNWSAFTTT